MEPLSNSIEMLKPKHRFHGFITDRVFLTLVSAFSCLVILDKFQLYQNLQFTLQSMIGIAPFFLPSHLQGMQKQPSSILILHECFPVNPDRIHFSNQCWDLTNIDNGLCSRYIFFMFGLLRPNISASFWRRYACKNLLKDSSNEGFSDKIY